MEADLISASASTQTSHAARWRSAAGPSEKAPRRHRPPVSSTQILRRCGTLKCLKISCSFAAQSGLTAETFGLFGLVSVPPLRFFPGFHHGGMFRPRRATSHPVRSPVQGRIP
ncbi:MAG: hypothetical protein BJ554DRAFT_1518 [Olpidium bornovanus]|uniref:Uncharacterized protein n=1 Tax=Olpidium bornovanus TaxID=278681 RepID=A0A8H8DH49_9FUNG|nr:MAG: hypothetical protein BJ554DRAFT_1518 [Olpidium bornovanus]